VANGKLGVKYLGGKKGGKQGPASRSCLTAKEGGKKNIVNYHRKKEIDLPKKGKKERIQKKIKKKTRSGEKAGLQKSSNPQPEKKPCNHLKTNAYSGQKKKGRKKGEGEKPKPKKRCFKKKDR